MKTITIKALTCHETEDWFSDECMLKIYTDGTHRETLEKDMDPGDVWQINKSYSFNNTVEIKLYDDDWPDADDHLGTQTLSGVTSSIALGTLAFREDDADYDLTFSVDVPGSATPAEISTISVRRFLGRLGRGVMRNNRHVDMIDKNLIYRIGCEVISFRYLRELHATQDGAKSGTVSLRRWIETHCDYFSPDTIITSKAAYRNWAEVLSEGNWEPVVSEATRRLSGFGELSRVTDTDNPFSHETRDWNMNVIPDPSFMYLLGSGMKGSGNGLDLVPYMHNEWESGSYPSQWRPFWGEYVTLEGRHIWDVGHSPVAAEFHPPHTVVREHTTAGPLGDGGAMVPVNRAVIGVGLSGGFPGDTGGRWSDEFGGVPSDVWGDTTDCWATNLKKHPVSFRMYPPVDRPTAGAQLRTRIVLCKYIKVNNWDQGDDFLELTQYDDPADGGEDKGFRDFMDAHGYPTANCPASAQPKLAVGTDSDGLPAYVDVRVDLNSLSGIPVGYYAIVECGWSVKGPHKLQRYKITFQTIKAIETDEWWDDWHLHYGVNGVWAWWWTDDYIEEGDTYTKNTIFWIWAVDDQPLVFRDCGVEWDGTDYANERLDQIALVATPSAAAQYSHLVRIAQLSGSDANLEMVSPSAGSVTTSTTSITFRLKGTGGDTRHQWKIRVEKTEEW